MRTIIPATLQQLQLKSTIVYVPVLWVDGKLVGIANERPRATQLAASRAAWKAARKIPLPTILRNFRGDEEERFMEAAEKP